MGLRPPANHLLNGAHPALLLIFNTFHWDLEEGEEKKSFIPLILLDDKISFFQVAYCFRTKVASDVFFFISFRAYDSVSKENISCQHHLQENMKGTAQGKYGCLHLVQVFLISRVTSRWLDRCHSSNVPYFVPIKFKDLG